VSEIRTLNPATGELLERFEPLDGAGIERALERAWTTFVDYRRTSLEERAGWLRAAADILESEKRTWAETMTTEMGKPIGAAVAEAEKCAWACRHYAEHGTAMLADREVETGAERSWIRHDPLGPVLAIMPWNFPFWQVFRFAAPALMAGNVGLLKHASNVPRCALAIEEVLRRAGFPDGAFQTLLIGSDPVEEILADPRVRAATLTGSEGAGRAVAGAAGRNLKKTVLELGGSDPFIIMPGADLDAAIRTGVKARTINNGQSCIAAKRFIVDRRIADRALERYRDAMAALVVGDPMDEATDVGPLATESIRDDLERQVRESMDAGARLALGGRTIDRPGWWFEPSILTDIPTGCPAYEEELFGPVAAWFEADGVDDAIRIANDTGFGLGSAAWTEDQAEQERFIAGLEAGQVFLNGMVASDPRLPFGGVKRSGYGRELSSHGILEFVNVKTVSVQSTAGAGETE